MASPPPRIDKKEGPRSPGLTSPSNTAAFIYPIRSAVSVQPLSPTQQERPPVLPHRPSQKDGSRPSLDRALSLTGASSDNEGLEGTSLVDVEDEDSRNEHDHFSALSDHAEEAPVDIMRRMRIGEDLPEYSSRTLSKRNIQLSQRASVSSATGSLAEKDRIESMTLPRFKHVQTEQGHMVVTGREGDITRCEDEPIHVPGAVQSFGCMVVVREEKDGALVVRQCSENTESILGWPPRSLFSLNSFLDCLDEDQADILWDTIETLEDSDKELSDSGPHVFQLSVNPRKSSEQSKQANKFWCAAHRLHSQNTSSTHPEHSHDDYTTNSLTVMEFELVRDTVNPIFLKSPPASPVAETGGSSSPSGLSSTGISPPPSITTVDSDGTTKISQAVTPLGKVKGGLDGMPYVPTPEQFIESTQASSKPLKALQRLRGITSDGKSKRPRPKSGKLPTTQHTTDEGNEMLDMFGILSQINEQLASQAELAGFLKVVVSIFKELTSFSRVMIYQFDEDYNGQVVCELVDWNDTHDLYRGLHFPATDIPKQARDLYMVNKVRLLYDRDQSSARMVCRDRSDLNSPVDMTHSFLRAMSPIHIKYLANMGVRASMSISITAFDQLWGLISLHTYGTHGRRVSFPMRQLCRLVGDSVSRNIERLSYTRRLSARKLINTLPTDQNPGGYIISNAEDLLNLFDADFGVIAIGNEAKILGPLSASQEVLAVTEYLRIKKYQHVITSQDVASDFPDMILPNGLEVIAGILVIPLSSSGIDFITFLRKAQTRHVNWAGKPFKEGRESTAVLEPRKSFKIWSEKVVGTCRAWKDEELETASVLSLVYGKFISVWRQREQAMQYNQLNKLLLSNATHEVRTPLNHIINYLELALDSPLDDDIRENLSKSHMASKSLLFVINDLLDLTRQEEGKELYQQEPFDLATTVREATEMHEGEAKRRKIDFSLHISPEKCFVLGDASRIRQVILNTLSNSVKYTSSGHIGVEVRRRSAEEITSDLPDGCDTEFEVSISDSGRGIPREKLEAIFREFEQVESVIADPSTHTDEGNSLTTRTEPPSDTREKRGELGLGLAIVARIVKNLGGQLRVDSTVGEGSRFTYYLPFKTSNSKELSRRHRDPTSNRSNSIESGGSGGSSVKSEINSLVEAFSAPHLDEHKSLPQRKSFDHIQSSPTTRDFGATVAMEKRSTSSDGTVPVGGSVVPLRSVKVDPHEVDSVPRRKSQESEAVARQADSLSSKFDRGEGGQRQDPPKIAIDKPTVSEVVAQPKVTSSSGESASSSAAQVSEGSQRSSHSSSAAQRRLAKAKLISPSLGQSAPQKLQPLRILVVEDDQINRMILKKRLGMDGHTVSLAVHGEDGVQQVEKKGHELDVVLMDLQMPICNGQDACRRIRALEVEQQKKNEIADRPPSHILNGRIPIFAVSASLDQSMREEMCEIGMDGWVLKPIDFARLRTLMKGITHQEERDEQRWKPGHVWEKGGWLTQSASKAAR